jgi:formylglycine-generating enzyme required for sulfatase activity
MSYIFISYANSDGSTEAHALAATLEAASRRCWIAPRDVQVGPPYSGQIVRAIEESHGLVLLLTPGANLSPAVLAEVELAQTERKLIATLMVRGTEPSADLRFFLSARRRVPWNGAAGAVAALAKLFVQQARPAGFRPGDIFRDGPDCPDLVMIGPGEFQMGSPDSEQGRHPNEGPVHTVHIADRFAAGKYPVTRGEWRQFVQATGRTGDSWLKRALEEDDGHPVLDVTWQDAMDYAGWLTQKTGHQYRLLSEAEWEFACRAGSRTAYFWGEKFDDRGPYMPTGRLTGTWPVGRWKANAFGLHDMTGLVSCWTQDRWHPDYRGAPADGSAWEAGDGWAVRGGSWLDGADASRFRPAYRAFGDDANFNVGFRVARTL